MAYSVTKAAQVHLMKCMAKTQGPKVRVNAVLPGLLLTEWVCVFSLPLPDVILWYRRRLMKKQGLQLHARKAPGSQRCCRLEA